MKGSIEHKLQEVFGTEHPVALVTGSGAPRLGNALVRTLAERGYWPIVHANRSVDAAQRTVEQLQAAGVPAGTVQGDLAEETVARRVVDEAYATFGRLDVLVNCAAIWQPKPLEEVTATDVRQYLDTNTVATFVCAQQAGLLMARQATGGVIINFGDWAVVRPYRDYAAYFPSKGAIPTLTRTLAVELAGRNPRVRVNAVLPGPVMLPEDLSPDERQAIVNETLVRREGRPHHVTEAVVALIENDFLTGVCLPVDGGRSISCPEN